MTSIPKVEEIKDLLHKVERTHAGQRKEYITRMQNLIWDETEVDNEDMQQIFTDLAYDLNFYEEDPRDRDDALGYYGEEHLKEVINTAIKKINDLEKK